MIEKIWANFNYYIPRIGVIKSIKVIMSFAGIMSLDLRQVMYDSYFSTIDLTDEANYKKELSDWYKLVCGKEKINIDNPETFDDKMQWIKLNDYSQRKAQCADKIEAKRIVNDKGIDGLLCAKTYGVWDDYDEIDFESLPDKFILKYSNGSGLNYLVDDKSDLDCEALKREISRWKKYKHIFGGGEREYWNIQGRILAEEVITCSSGRLNDYKFYCFNGVPKYIHVIVDRDLKNATAKECFYNTEWEKQDFVSGVFPRCEEDIARPEHLEKMIYIAGALSAEFKFVRIDLYEADGAIYFGEFTFTPGQGAYKWIPAKTNYDIGRLIEIS